MMAEIWKGAPASAEIVRGIKEQLNGRTPRLTVIGTEADPSFASYVKRILKTAKEIGIETEYTCFPADVSEKEFLGALRKANADPGVDGVLLSMPLPKQISFENTQNLMRFEKDVDGLSLKSRARLYEGRSCFLPCTAEAVLKFLEYHHVEISGMEAVVVGRSPVVGRPLAMGLLAKDATVTVCHRKTKDLFAVTRRADLLITAAGSAGLISKEAVKPGAIVIDVGMSKDAEGHLTGDTDLESVSETASAVAPAFGGVGVLTAAILLQHVAEAFLKKQKTE